MLMDWLQRFREELTTFSPLSRQRRRRVRHGARGVQLRVTEALESRVMLAGSIGEVTSFTKISDTVGGFTGVLDNFDRFGSAVANLGDLDGDGIVDMAVGVPDDDDGGFERGAVNVLFLNADGTVKSHQKISDIEGGFTATLADGDFFGSSVTCLGDLDGDGINDLAVGSYFDKDGGSYRGAVYVLFLNADGTVKGNQKISDTEGNFTATLDNDDRFGISVSSLGDLDGDGNVDLAVGAFLDDDGGFDRGAVYVLFLNANGTVKSYQKISDNVGSFTAVLDDDHFGHSLANLGDLDGDGFIDLAVGATLDDDGGSTGDANRGAVYVLFLKADGTVRSHQKISDTVGNFTATLDDNDRIGSSVSNLGDLDSDGINDLAIGAIGDDDGGDSRGAVYALLLNADGTVKLHQKISDTEGNFTAILDNSDLFGRSLTNLGDVDGDGIAELAVGADFDDDGGLNHGAVYILSLEGVTPPGVVTATRKISDTAGNFTAILDNSNQFGSSVARLGDLDGDGIADLAVGAEFDDDGGSRRGAVYILFLASDGTVKSFQKISNTAGNFTATLNDDDFFGSSLTNLGDLNGDGVVDLGVGATGDDDGGGDHGAVYFLFLNADGTVKSHQKISDTAGGFSATLDFGDWFGRALSNLGDLDGDGIAELAVGADGDDDGGDRRGAVYVLFLNADGTVKSHQKISDTAGNFTGILDDVDLFGHSLSALRDLNGDGIIDLAVGSPLSNDGGSDRGGIYVLFLDADGTVKSHQKISDIDGGFAGKVDDGDFFGFSLTNLGDLDGDKIEDLAVGADGDDDGGPNRGAVYVLSLNQDGIVRSHQKISQTAGGFTTDIDDGERFGRSLTNMGDLDGDGIAELVSGAPLNRDGGPYRGAIYIMSQEAITPPGVVTATRKISDTAGNFTATLENFDYFGGAVADLGDLDGDGIVDMAVGAYRDDDHFPNTGAVYVLFLNADGTVKSHQKISDTAGNFTATLDESDFFGSSLTKLGDLDGDGIVDLAVGAYLDDDGGLNRGAVYVLFMNANGTVKSHQKISDTIGNFTASLDDGDSFGSSITNLGDLDGDGIADLAVGAFLDDDGGFNRGAVYVLFLNVDGTVKSHQKVSDTAGNFAPTLDDVDFFGRSLTKLGDLNGDGVADLAVGVERDDDGGSDRGAVYVLFLNADGTVKSHQKLSDTTGNFTSTLDDGDFFGCSLTNIGDLDGDRIFDLVVGAEGDDDGGTRHGAAYVLFLNADGTVKSHQKISDTQGNFTTTLDDIDFFGSSLTKLGDLDGDGIADLAVGALRDDDGGNDRGAMYILSLAGVPIVPTSVSASSVNGTGNPNRSGIRELTFTFDQAVTLGSPTALNLFNHSTGLPVDLTNAVLMGDGTTTVTWVLHDGPGVMTDVVLADGQ
ncbi:MAG: FG-GAP repeat protein, partial [Planctomycetaceae bacterium]|nr:FG-GAP repeat protein [Planctomycetaceae bacterium]